MCSCSLLDDAPSKSLAVRLDVTVKSLADSGEVVPGAHVSLAEKQLGISNAQGLLTATLEGQPGTVHQLTVKCPTGFASPEKPIDVTITQLAPGSPAPQFLARCTALAHKTLLGIRTENGADLPIVYLGNVIGRTDTQGVAHVSLTLPAGETATVLLDTSSKPELIPQNPKLVFKAGAKDELVLLEQKFALPKKKPVVKREPPRPMPL